MGAERGNRGMMSPQVGAGSGLRPAAAGSVLSLGSNAGKDAAFVCVDGDGMMWNMENKTV